MKAENETLFKLIAHLCIHWNENYAREEGKLFVIQEHLAPKRVFCDGPDHIIFKFAGGGGIEHGFDLQIAKEISQELSRAIGDATNPNRWLK